MGLEHMFDKLFDYKKEEDSHKRSSLKTMRGYAALGFSGSSFTEREYGIADLDRGWEHRSGIAPITECRFYSDGEFEIRYHQSLFGMGRNESRIPSSLRIRAKVSLTAEELVSLRSVFDEWKQERLGFAYIMPGKYGSKTFYAPHMNDSPFVEEREEIGGKYADMSGMLREDSRFYGERIGGTREKLEIRGHPLVTLEKLSRGSGNSTMIGRTRNVLVLTDRHWRPEEKRVAEAGIEDLPLESIPTEVGVNPNRLLADGFLTLGSLMCDYHDQRGKCFVAETSYLELLTEAGKFISEHKERSPVVLVERFVAYRKSLQDKLAGSND